jgi:hypothetical protein
MLPRERQLNRRKGSSLDEYRRFALGIAGLQDGGEPSNIVELGASGRAQIIGPHDEVERCADDVGVGEVLPAPLPSPPRGERQKGRQREKTGRDQV